MVLQFHSANHLSRGGRGWFGGDFVPNFTNSSEFQIEMINDTIYSMVGPLISYLPQLVWCFMDNVATLAFLITNHMSTHTN